MTGSQFARWARRKRAAQGTPAAATVHPDTPPPALPAIEEITALTDIRGFLHPGVSAELRKAALRRAWLVDPAVRDFAGPARDYDFDWTRAEGLPAGGPITPPPTVDAHQVRVSDATKKEAGDA
jgi:hypothetical protein